MKKLLLLAFCFLALGISAQQKKTTKPKAKTSLTQKKKNLIKDIPSIKVNYETCTNCKGTGECPECNGNWYYACPNHHVEYGVDEDCAYNDGENCDYQINCSSCGRWDSTWRCSYCLNGKCRECHGKGIVNNGNEKKPKK